MSTARRTILPAGVVGGGTDGAYRRLGFGPGEPHRVRPVPGVAPGIRRRRRELLRFAHLTDLQLADTQSPGRFEFFERLTGRPGAKTFTPAWRPQDSVAAHACATTAATLRALAAKGAGERGLDFVLCTGDSLDNAQLNELTWFISLLSGGGVDLRSGGGGPYHGVLGPSFADDLYWHPDGGLDRYKRRWGFPAYPDLLEEAFAPFSTPGVTVPWLSCFGNHDGLVLGTAVATAGYEEVVTGSSKPVDLPDGVDPIGQEDAFIEAPERFLTGPARTVPPGADRRTVGRREFVAAHLAAPGLPRGHGFSAENLEAGTAYGVYDGVEGVRVVLLDTTNLDGHYDGSIGARQLAWLEERLVEVHRQHLDRDGAVVRAGGEDRLVVLASHHGIATLSNDRQLTTGREDDHPRALAGEVAALLARFPNVVAWCNGHRHKNEVVYRPSPLVGGRGYWEISTASLADWPCQVRLVELVANDDGTLSILLTMVDHEAPPDPSEAEGVARLAAIHRELAANDPFAGTSAGLEGTPEDRNVELVLAAPFEL